MVWNEPSDDGSNGNPWRKKNKKLEKNLKKYKSNKIFFFNIKKCFVILKNLIKNNSKNLGSSKNIKIPIITILIFIPLLLFFKGFYIVKETEQGVVTNLGKFSRIVNPGLHWRPIFIEQVKYVDVATVTGMTSSNLLLNAEQKLLNIETNMEYKIVNVKDYFFSVTNPDEIMRQITNGVLYNVIGCFTTDKILTKDNNIIKKIIQKEIEKKITLFKLGIKIIDINFKKIDFPKEIRHSLDLIQLARKKKKEYINKAKSYADEVIFLANNKSDYILRQSKLYNIYKIVTFKRNIIFFSKIFYKYKIKRIFFMENLY
ncbi:FtsH protease activity modulator HflK [Buchnera aphidicola (Pemphigus obesinymphae)]|uniref:FtsH protease activity modulator HflK n=1 Tax=Buchnera aphidicola TaxID=9 RepID=UPI002238CA51|nr:FtsH protease activity modulator HflK [Buchnera aphidicola]MCW5196460.1 FtsH protease activity modulator HflK [Buchnera aphidicola (Pemphigus obesinymphae)]